MPPLPFLLSIHPYALLPLLFYQIPSEMTIALLLRIFWWISPCLFPWFSGIFNREDLRSEENLGGRCASISKKFWGKGKGWFWVERLIVIFFFENFLEYFFQDFGFCVISFDFLEFLFRTLSRKILEDILISRKIGVLKKVDYGFFFKFSNIFLRFEDFLEFLIRRKYSRKIF